MKGQEEREGVGDAGRKGKGVVWGCDQPKEGGWVRKEGRRDREWCGAVISIRNLRGGREGGGRKGARSWVLGARLWVWGIVCGQGVSFVGVGSSLGAGGVVLGHGESFEGRGVICGCGESPGGGGCRLGAGGIVVFEVGGMAHV